MERRCGDIDNRLKKKARLETVSRGIILKNADQHFPANEAIDFHAMCPVVRKIKKIKVEWHRCQQELRAIGLDAKQAMLLDKERKKLTLLENLRGAGRPFASEDEVEQFILTNLSDEDKQKRMKQEVQYARDTYTSFPRTHPVFKIMNTSVVPRRILTALEFGENLKIYLGKRAARTDVYLADYRVGVAQL